jgi:hypothetical protein
VLGAVTVREIVVVGVRLPDVPVMVTVAGPIAAVLLAASVKVLVPVVGFVLNDAVTPPGRPDPDKLTLPLNPFSGLMEMMLVPLFPCSTVKLLGDADRVKLGTAAAVTVRLTVVVFVKLPDIPVMVTVAGPVIAVLPAVNVKVLVPVVVGFVLNDAPTPLGSPEADRVTLLLKPFCAVTEIVLVPLFPCTMLRLLGDADKEKFGGGGTYVLTMTLSKVAVAREEVLLLVTPRPMYAVCPMGIVWLVPSWTQFTLSDEL